MSSQKKHQAKRLKPWTGVPRPLSTKQSDEKTEAQPQQNAKQLDRKTEAPYQLCTKPPDRKIETVIEMNEYSEMPADHIIWEDPPQTDMEPYITFVAINSLGKTVTSVRFYYRDLIEIFNRIENPYTVIYGPATELQLKKLMVICGCFRRLSAGIMISPWILPPMCMLHFGDYYMTVFMAAGMPYTIDTPGIDSDMPKISYIEAVRDRIARVRKVCFEVINKFWGSIRGFEYLIPSDQKSPLMTTASYPQLLDVLRTNPSGIYVKIKMTRISIVFFTQWNEFITVANSAANLNHITQAVIKLNLPKRAKIAILSCIVEPTPIELDIIE